jgi:hypothetical protein
MAYLFKEYHERGCFSDFADPYKKFEDRNTCRTHVPFTPGITDSLYKTGFNKNNKTKFGILWGYKEYSGFRDEPYCRNHKPFNRKNTDHIFKTQFEKTEDDIRIDQLKCKSCVSCDRDNYNGPFRSLNLNQKYCK